MIRSNLGALLNRLLVIEPTPRGPQACTYDHNRAFASEVTGLHARLVRVVFATCGEVQLAEDSAQEALLQAWKAIDNGTELRSLEAWTIRVALNWCRTQLRRSGAEDRALARVRSFHIAERPTSITDHVCSPRLDGDLQRALLSLPQRQREVIVLHYLVDLEIAAIAEILERSDGAVKNALFNGRASLAKQLASPKAAKQARTQEQSGTKEHP